MVSRKVYEVRNSRGVKRFRARYAAIDECRRYPGSTLWVRRGVWDNWRQDDPSLETSHARGVKLTHTAQAMVDKNLHDGLDLLAEQWQLGRSEVIRRILTDRLKEEIPALWGPLEPGANLQPSKGDEPSENEK